MNSQVFLSQTRHRDPAREAIYPMHTPKILVADDEEGIRELIADILAGAGCDVVAVCDGQQAWEELHRRQYDLLVTDNDMPCLSGLELIERIRKGGTTMPIIVASGTFAAESIGKDPRLQVTAFLAKPFYPQELLRAVRRALGTGCEVNGRAGWHAELIESSGC